MNIKHYIHGIIQEEIELFKYEQVLSSAMLYEVNVSGSIPQSQVTGSAPQQPQTQQPQSNTPQQPTQQQPTQQPTQPTTPTIPVISKQDAAAKIRASKGKLFTCIFIKRSDGTKRSINCRLGVKRYLRGGTLPYDPNVKRLIPVFDLKVNDYRMINIDGIIALKINGEYFQVK